MQKGARAHASSEYLISDGFHTVKAIFTKECQEEMEDIYPSCINVHTLDNRLLCIKDYEIELKMPFNDIENIIKNKRFRD